MIKATGYKRGERLTVEIKQDGQHFEYLFNGKPDYDLQMEIELLCAKGVPIGGTFYPETEEMKRVAVLSGWFFDRRPEVLEHDCKEQIPFEKGRKY